MSSEVLAVTAVPAESLLIEYNRDDSPKLQVVTETNPATDTKPDLTRQYQSALELLRRINRPICRPPA